MKICVLISDSGLPLSAGIRIRYQRIIERLKSRGVLLEIKAMQEFMRPQSLIHDVYIISKCYDARSLLIARILSDNQKLVGIDLFDDYFSYIYDSRFTRFRAWFDSLRGNIDFVLCSTTSMQTLSKKLSPELPSFVMNDPSPPINVEVISDNIRSKIINALDTKKIKICWFGIGDNPNFPLGLIDLVSYGGLLQSLNSYSFDVELSILTNKRAMTAEGLFMLRRLSVPYTIEEWTENREEKLLKNSLVSFLPVNSQNFSIVKSLNRAITSLSSGAQVLSAGYPLYQSLSPFIYRKSEKIIQDIVSKKTLLDENSVTDFIHLLEKYGNPGIEADKFCENIASINKKNHLHAPARVKNSQKPLAAVIHGILTHGLVHKFSNSHKALSVSSPFCNAGYNFDVRVVFDKNKTNLEVFLSNKTCSLINQDLQKFISPHGKNVDTMYKKIEYSRAFPELESSGAIISPDNNLISIVSCYPRTMLFITRFLQCILPGIDCFYSENTTLPVHTKSSNKLMTEMT